jgi:hypothetical protein
MLGYTLHTAIFFFESSFVKNNLKARQNQASSTIKVFFEKNK